MTEHLASVFLSYSWADKPLARGLAEGLDASGCRVWIDEGELRVGDSLVQSISEALERVDFVVALVSAASVGSDWCRKEISLAMTGEVKRQGVTVMPLRVGDVDMPPTLKDKVHLEVDPDDVPGAVERLLRDIRRHLEPPAPLPPRRRAPGARPVPRKPAPAARPTSSLAEPPKPAGPLRIVEVDRGGITAPRNDGTPGSALYAVPLRLSAVPDRAWAELFVWNWDRPPSFTSMHRPGIARVTGDRIVLEGRRSRRSRSTTSGRSSSLSTRRTPSTPSTCAARPLPRLRGTRLRAVTARKSSGALPRSGSTTRTSSAAPRRVAAARDTYAT